jgi:peptidoglycan/LPS O-acetylase OafA/YrhL
MSGTSYRTDVQGLRGVAVLAVVAYHAGLPLSGGFIGVDVFFVVSGFVVSLMIKREVTEHGSLDFIEFFSRRVRRLVPIYLVVVLATIGLSVVFLSPFGEQQQAFSTARWSSFFAANIELFLADTYQNLVGNPFRHLWSLSVEEQFYLILPLIFVWSTLYRNAGAKVAMKRAEIVIAVSTAASLIYCLWLARQPWGSGSVKWAFFGMPTRLWEFGVGILVALAAPAFGPQGRVIPRVISVVSLVVLLLSFVVVDDDWRFPGPVTVIPVVATGLLLWLNPYDHVVKNWLSLAPLRHLGDVSYGWYLWHWPLVVFTALVFPNRIDLLVVASVGALVLSVFTYWLIEQPLRRKRSIVGIRAGLLLVASMASIIGGTFVAEIAANSGYGLRASGASDFEFGLDFELDQRGGNMDGSCFLRGLEYAFDDLSIIGRECSNGVASNDVAVLLLGDSNALAASAGVFEAAESLGLRAVAFAGAGCPLLRGTPLDKAERCPLVQDSYRQLINDLEPEIVVIVNRYDLYVGPLAHYLDDDHRLLTSDGQPPDSKAASLKAVVSAVQVETAAIAARGINVVVMLQPPPGLLTGRTLFERWRPQIGSAQRLGIVATVNQRMLIRDTIRTAMVEVPGVEVLDIANQICSRSDYCEAREGQEILYGDFSHLNNAGSLKLTNVFIDVFKRIVKR